MERDKSNSITQLVKIVAREIVDEELKDIRERIIKLEIQEFPNAGDFWNGFEDDSLVKNIDNFVTTAARKHGRTEGAIRARMKDYFNGKEIK